MTTRILSLALITAMVGTPAPAQETAGPPRVEVVFALDTTGSMSGLIEGAKQKIWSIANEIASGKPTPELRIGLVPYRDRGDAYITRVIDLTDDLDAVYEELVKFSADGGGDGPESVNQALHDAVHKIAWSTSRDVLKIIFLVGDYPPHMDYQDDVHYPTTCADAAKSDIIINTVQCGGNNETTEVWTRIADLSEGEFAQIDQGGGMQVVATPYDEELAKLGRDMGGTRVAYGGAARPAAMRSLARSEAVAASAPASAAADRLSYSAKAGGMRVDSYDFVAGYARGEISLGETDGDALPDEIKDIPQEEQKAWLDERAAKQKEIQKQIEELTVKRDAFVKEQIRELGGEKDAFDRKVLATIRTQAAAKGIAYEATE